MHDSKWNIQSGSNISLRFMHLGEILEVGWIFHLDAKRSKIIAIIILIIIITIMIYIIIIRTIYDILYYI